MLIPAQRAWLKRALDKNLSGDDGGSFVGKTYAEMAEIFNQKHGTSLSAEGLRYNVRTLGKKGLSPGRTFYRSEEHKLVGEIGHLMLAITRFSPRKVYCLMRENSRFVFPMVSCVSFYNLLRAVKPVQPSRLPDPSARYLPKRYQLRLHQICLVDIDGNPVGVWLVGFEAYTGFCHVQWFELRYQRRHTKPGRPKKIPDGKECPTALLLPQSQILLPEELVIDFCEQLQSRFYLPLTQFQIPHGQSSARLAEGLKFGAWVPDIAVDSLPGSVITLPATSTSKDFERWQSRARRWINHHNRHLVQEHIADEWNKLLSEQLKQPARTSKNCLFAGDKRRTRKKEEEALSDFYRTHPRYPGKLAPLTLRKKIVRLEKKPETPGETAVDQPPDNPPASDTASATS